MKKIIILLLFSTSLGAQIDTTYTPTPQAIGWIGPAIELIGGMLRDDRYEIEIKVDANGKKGKLYKRYNKWLKKGRITDWQYDQLISELAGIPIHSIRLYRLSAKKE